MFDGHGNTMTFVELNRKWKSAYFHTKHNRRFEWNAVKIIFYFPTAANAFRFGIFSRKFDDGMVALQQQQHLPSKRITSCWFKKRLRWPLTAAADTSRNNPKQKHEFFNFDILHVCVCLCFSSIERYLLPAHELRFTAESQFSNIFFVFFLCVSILFISRCVYSNPPGIVSD